MDYEAEPVQQSFLSWMMESVGPVYLIVLVLLGLLLLIGGSIVVLASRRPGVIAACLAFVPLPLLIGLLGMLQGMLQSFSIVATSSVQPKPSELAAGYSAAMMTPLLAIAVTIPGLLVLATGLLVRSIIAARTTTVP